MSRAISSARHADWSTLAARLGLSYRPAAQPGHAGELNGILREHRVLVRPDRPALHVEYRLRVAGLHVSTARGRGAGSADFTSGRRDFDRAFPLRATPAPADAALAGAAAFHEAALRLARRRPRHWERIDFEAQQLVLTFRPPGWLRWRRGLTPLAAEAALPGMIEAVEALEAALRNYAQRAREPAIPGNRQR